MPLTVVVNNEDYEIPLPGEVGWGEAVDLWIQAISSTTLQKSGGSFTLTAETDFGAAFGLMATYFKTRSATPATVGAVRLATLDTIAWRNNSNSADVLLRKKSSDDNILQFALKDIINEDSNQTINNKVFGDSGTIDASSVLEAKSTTKGVLISRMTTAQISAIASPATGLLIFDTSNNYIVYYNGSTFEPVGSNVTVSDPVFKFNYFT